LIALALGMAQILGSLAILMLAVKHPNELDATDRVAMEALRRRAKRVIIIKLLVRRRLRLVGMPSALKSQSV
jgi:hypothetical protein